MSDTTVEQEPRLQLNAAKRRYEIWLGESRAGVAIFRETDTHVTFLHTIVDDAFGGRGLGSELARYALQDTIDRGKRIVPVCPFIGEYVKTHHDFDDHLDPQTKVTS